MTSYEEYFDMDIGALKQELELALIRNDQSVRLTPRQVLDLIGELEASQRIIDDQVEEIEELQGVIETYENDRGFGRTG
jgi:hypothetical protein